MKTLSIPERPLLVVPAFWRVKDARHWQMALQFALLLYGIFFLNWYHDVDRFLFTMLACIVVQAVAIQLTTKDFTGLKSAFISSLSLCLLLKTNAFATIALAAALSIGSKYVLRWKGKHFFNPTNFGIIITILISGDAWLSPGQWGNHLLLVFLIIAGGSSVLLRVGRWDSSLMFIGVFGAMQFLRLVVYQGWEPDVFLHSLSSGTLLLFTFFMITDPKSSPDARPARMVWAACIGLIAFVLTSWYYVYAAPLWALFVMSPFTPLFDRIWKYKKFEWISTSSL